MTRVHQTYKTKTMKITKELLRQLRQDINTALGAVADVHGIKLEAGKASFTDSTFTFKLDGIVKGGKSNEAQRYELHEKLLGLPPLFTRITLRDVEYETAGLNTTGTKVVLTRLGDLRHGFVIAVDVVKRAVASKPTA